MKPPVRFPVLVKAGSTTAKIYKVRKQQAKAGYCYTVSAHHAGQRIARQYTTLERAKEEARRIVDVIDRGRAAVESQATASDLAELAAARELVGEVGLLSALHEWKRASEISGGRLLEAAAAWRATQSLTESLTVIEAVKRFLEARKARGVDIKSTYRNRLDVFCKDFGDASIGSLQATHLQAWLARFQVPATHNTYRRNMVALFRWCARQGYLPRNGPTEAELTETMQEPETDVGLFSPSELEQIARILESDHRHYLAPMVLAAWCGMRRVEVHAQLWSDIDLKAGHLNVTAAKKRTVKNRFITLHPTAVAWLRISPRNGDPIAGNLALDRIRDIARSRGIQTPENGFRHGWISARCTITGDPARVAAEAGNSPKQIHRHYRRPLPLDVAEAWFSILPSPSKTAP